jgi:hypothetical protein
MILAAVGDTGYNIMLFLHIVAMFVAFAPAFVHPFLDSQTEGYSNRAQIWEAIAVRGQRIYGGALIVGGLLGFAVAGMSDDAISVSDSWLWPAVVLWIAMNGVLHALIVPGERAVGQGDESKVQNVRIGGMAITAMFLVTMYLMVFKPGV